jgi:hypothetical protein
LGGWRKRVWSLDTLSNNISHLYNEFHAICLQDRIYYSFHSSRRSSFFFSEKVSALNDYSETEKLKDTPVNFSRIRCPFMQLAAARIEPLVLQRFRFAFRMRSEWNTFDTRGRCPGLRLSMEMDGLFALLSFLAARSVV